MPSPTAGHSSCCWMICVPNMIVFTAAGANRFNPREITGLMHLSIRDSVTSDLPLRTLSRRVARSLSEAEENGALPFQQVIREAQRPPSLDGGIQFLSHDGSSRTLQLGSSSLRPVELPVEESPFELSIAVSAAAPRLKITFAYRPTLYPSSGIEHLARQYAALLQSVAATPHATVRQLHM